VIFAGADIAMDHSFPASKHFGFFNVHTRFQWSLGFASVDGLHDS
jgi:hypothetical protein